MAGELAKVLWYYNLIPNTHTAIQKIVCPFHADVNPSMMIDLEENRCYCFGCSKGFDALDFVIAMEKKYSRLNDLQACLRYFKILKSKKCSSIHIAKNIKNKQSDDSSYRYAVAYDYYHGLGRVDWDTSQIEEVVAAREYMIKRGFSTYALNKCGAKVTYENSYGLIFPMLDNGKFKGWVRRTMRKDIESKRKYLYNKGFSRTNTLVGNYGNKDYVFVVEGYMDKLKFNQYGEDNVVAILGWKMTDAQAKKLKDKGIKHIISALDNDECGRNGTKYLKTMFEVTRFTYLKGIKDPGEMSEDKFNLMYSHTMDIFHKNIKNEKKGNGYGTVRQH